MPRGCLLRQCIQVRMSTEHCLHACQGLLGRGYQAGGYLLLASEAQRCCGSPAPGRGALSASVSHPACSNTTLQPSLYDHHKASSQLGGQQPMWLRSTAARTPAPGSCSARHACRGLCRSGCQPNSVVCCGGAAKLGPLSGSSTDSARGVALSSRACATRLSRVTSLHCIHRKQ